MTKPTNQTLIGADWLADRDVKLYRKNFVQKVDGYSEINKKNLQKTNALIREKYNNQMNNKSITISGHQKLIEMRNEALKQNSRIKISKSFHSYNTLKGF